VFEDGKLYNEISLDDIRKKQIKYRDKDNYLKLTSFYDNNQIRVHKRENSNSLLYVAMFNSIKTTEG